MKTPSASSFTRPRRAILAAIGSLAFFLLPFVLFHPEKKPVPPRHVSKRSIEFLPAGNGAADPGLDYILQRHDPRLFLFPGEKRGFALFRVRPDIPEPAISSGIRSDLLFPARGAAVLRPTMKPAPLPRSAASFSAPLFVPSLRDLPGEETSSSPAESASREPFAPVIRTASGNVLPGSRIDSFRESEIRSLRPQGPTRLLVEPPPVPGLPGHADLLVSCGVSRLDREACRRLDLLLQSAAFPDHSSGPEVFSIYWLPPSVSSAFSAKLGEDKEEPGS